MLETMSPFRCKVTVGLEHASGAGAGADAGGETLAVREVKVFSRAFAVAGTSGTNVSDMG